MKRRRFTLGDIADWMHDAGYSVSRADTLEAVLEDLEGQIVDRTQMVSARSLGVELMFMKGPRERH